MPLKVLAVLHSAELYGAQRSFLDVVRHTSKHELEFVVALPSLGPTAALLDEMEIPFEVTEHRLWIPTRNSASRLYWPRYLHAAPAIHRRLRAMIERSRPDVVYTNTVTVLDGALAARSARIPHVWHLREAVKGNHQLASLLPQWLVWRIVAALSTRVIFNSKFLECQYTSPGQEKCVVVYNGIEPPAEQRAGPAASVTQRAPAIVSVGFMDRRKGLDVLLDAARLLAGQGIAFRVLVAGHFAQEYRRHEIEPRLSDPLLRDRVELLGWCADVSAVYEQADLVVSSSRQEPFGRTILEAMARGLPVVSTKSGGPEEIIVDGESGFLTPVDDPRGLAEAISRVLRDRALATRLGDTGRALAGERFSVAAMAEGVANALLRATECR